MKFTRSSFCYTKNLPYNIAHCPNIKAVVLQPSPNTFYIEPFWKQSQPLEHQKHLEGLVGGETRKILHPSEEWIAYIRKNHKLYNRNKRNDFGRAILNKVGFVLDEGCNPIFGNIVLFGKDDLSLTNEQISLIKNFLKKFSQKK